MDAPFDPEAMLAEMATILMRAARVVSRMLEIEQAAVEVAAVWLPKSNSTPASLSEAAEAGHAADDVIAAIAPAAQRANILAAALDRLSRSMRRTIALRKRLQAGWPRSRAADDRPAMLRGQVARGVTSMIRHATEGEAAECLFDDLAERLDDPALDDDLQSLPVEEVVRRICRDLGLVTAALQPLAAQPPYTSPAPVPHRKQSG